MNITRRLRYKISLVGLLIASAFVLGACTGNAAQTPTLDVDAAQTQAVATIFAGVTQTAMAAVPLLPS